jgi:hypothetical protein
MKLFIADSCANHTKIEIVSGIVGSFQNPIRGKLFEESGTIESADAVLVPQDAYYFSEYPDYLNYLNDLSKKKMIIFSDRGDFPKKPKLKNSIALRVALNPSEKLSGKIIIPYNVEDLSVLPFRQYSKTPDISFVGYMPRNSLGRFMKSGQQSPLHILQGNSAIVRSLAHRKVQKTKLQYRYSLRDSYGALNVRPEALSRIEYLESISASDFVLSPRGDANQSARYYEILSAGRIPLMPETQIRFPKIMESINSPNITFPLFSSARNVRQRILSRWESISNDEHYFSLQRDIRDFFSHNLEFNRYVESLFSLDTKGFLHMSEDKQLSSEVDEKDF